MSSGFDATEFIAGFVAEAEEHLALSNANVQRFVAGQNVKKVVVVPGRLVNLVI